MLSLFGNKGLIAKLEEDIAAKRECLAPFPAAKLRCKSAHNLTLAAPPKVVFFVRNIVSLAIDTTVLARPEPLSPNPAGVSCDTA